MMREPVSYYREQIPVFGTGIFPKGDEPTEYAVACVGISPAKDEMRTGKPMTGWSGQLLRKTLEQLKVHTYYLTNSFLCHYPEDASESTINQAYRCCHNRLMAELKDVGVQLTVALGNGPLQNVTGQEYKIRAVSGHILDTPVGKVLPVIHPASLRRRPDEFYDFLDGIKMAPRYMRGAYVIAEPPKMVVVDDEEKLRDLCQTIHNAEHLALDLETTKTGFYPYGRDPDKIRCMSLAVETSTAYIVPGYSSPHFEQHPNFCLDPKLKEVVNKAKLITHNGPFDVGFLLQEGYECEMFFDTFLAHYILDERAYSHGLKPLSHKYRGAPDWEEDIHKYLPHKKSSYDLIPDDALYWYASWDSVNTLGLSEESFRRQVGHLPIYKDLLMPCANMFTKIRHKGIPVDVEYLMNMDEQLEHDLEEAMEELDRLVGEPVNPFSVMELREILYDKLKFPEDKRYGRSTSKKVLALYKDSPIIRGVIECREIGKLKSTYVVGLATFLDRNFRIHPFTKLHGAVTGRISTEDPSVMNVTKRGGVKKLYIPDEGHWLAEMDQKQMEIRCYTAIANDEHLRELIISGADPHKLVAQELARRLHLNWDGMTEKEQDTLRQKCKTGVFGRMYGRGIESFKFGFGLREEDAWELIRVIDDLFPSIKEYGKKVKWTVHNVGYLESFFGRRRRFGLVIDENKADIYRQGMNFYVQSMASDVNLFCMLHLWANKEKWGVWPFFPVHDSILMDVQDPEMIGTIKKELEAYSRELVGDKIVFKEDVKIGKNWGEAKPWDPSVDYSKLAKKVIVNEGPAPKPSPSPDDTHYPMAAVVDKTLMESIIDPGKEI